MNWTLILVVVLVMPFPATALEPRWPQSGPNVGPSSEPTQIAFKVVVWYRKAHPLASFKYEIYDLRKGEFTPAVNAWSESIRTKYTAYYVAIRDVDLRREKGDTESLKVGAVVKRELAVAAALDGVAIGPGLPPAHGPRPTVPALIERRSSLGWGSSSPPDLNAPAPSFPVPMPYPRPHP